MATDIRGIPTTAVFAMGRLILATPQAGLTVGDRYWPLAIAVDCAPANPVVYVLVANDNGAMVAVPASAFSFQIDNLIP